MASTTSSRAASAAGTWIRRSMRGTAICCWPRSNVTPMMRGRSSTWPRATSIWAISPTHASGMLGGSRWAAGTRRSITRCSRSPSQCRGSVRRGPRSRTPTCGHGSSGRPARSPCMPSPTGTAPISATGSATFLPNAPPKSRCRKRTSLFVGADVYNWRAVDEQAVCASWIGKHMEAFTLCRRMLARRDIPDDDRKRIAGNRDISAPPMIDAASSYPDVLAQSLVAGPRDSEVTVSLVAGPDRGATEQTLNSFLRCCVDVPRVGRFLVVNAGLSAEDRATLLERYRFLEFMPFPSRGWARRPARENPRRDRRTVLATSRPGLAVLRARTFHRPPDCGS